MTKWGSAETRNQNYDSLGSALVMLAFQSTGYGLSYFIGVIINANVLCTLSQRRLEPIHA
jgi:hypothetical protein